MAWHGWCGRLFVRCGVDRLVVGSQAFYYASAFNANIGSWNTASVTALSSVFAPPRPPIYVRRYYMFMYAHARTHTRTHARAFASVSVTHAA